MMYKLRLILSAAMVVLSGCSHLAYIDRQEGMDKVPYPHIRVRILEGPKLGLMCEGTYRVNCISADSTAKGYYSLAPLMIMAGKTGMMLSEGGGFLLDSGLVKIFVSPRNARSHLLIDDKPFRGALEILYHENNLQVINVLNIEDYLKGVLPPEIGRLDQDGYEALKAQSVAARTYAYSRLVSNGDKRYHLVNNIMDQVYIGIQGEYELANQAIAETKGEVLTFGGKTIAAYYHSTCGGKTEDVSNIWDQHLNGYLKSIDDSGFCSWSKFYTWEMTWTQRELAGYIADYLRGKRDFPSDSLTILDIRIMERFPSGRISHLKVATDHGDFLFFKDQIRWAFKRPGKPDQILPSSDFELTLWRDQNDNIAEISASGRGYGHGAGMCQTGAIGRARAGQDYRTILKAYYSGIKIEKVY